MTDTPDPKMTRLMRIANLENDAKQQARLARTYCEWISEISKIADEVHYLRSAELRCPRLTSGAQDLLSISEELDEFLISLEARLDKQRSLVTSTRRTITQIDSGFEE